MWCCDGFGCLILDVQPGTVNESFDDFCWRPNSDTERRDHTGHNAVGADDNMFADIGAWKYDASVAKPRSVTDAYRFFRHRLYRDGKSDVFVPMVLIGDVNVVSGPHVITDFDGKMAHDSTALPNQAPITY